MIYFEGERLINTDCDIIIHECYCKKTDMDEVNEILFQLYRDAKKLNEDYNGTDIEKIKTVRMSVDKKTKKIIVNFYSKFSKELTSNKDLEEVNLKNYEETLISLCNMLETLQKKAPVKVGFMNLQANDGRNTMEIWRILMETSQKYGIDFHIIEV